jgi:hypothetical protein
VPLEVQLAWLPGQPSPITGAKFTPSGPLASNPSFAGGAKLPYAVQFAWIPPLPAPIVAVNLHPKILDPSAFVLSPRLVTVASEVRLVTPKAGARTVTPGA